MHPLSVHRTAVRALIWQALADAYATAVQEPASPNICFWSNPRLARPINCCTFAVAMLIAVV